MIQDFMAVNIEKELKVLQYEIAKDFLDKGQLKVKSTTLVLYDLIKKRCTFDKFINLISKAEKS